jgi:hypothetical protein
MTRVWRAGPGHDPFNSALASSARASCRACVVASARSAGLTRHSYIYIFILQKTVNTYVQFIFNIKNS